MTPPETIRPQNESSRKLNIPALIHHCVIVHQPIYIVKTIWQGRINAGTLRVWDEYFRDQWTQKFRTGTHRCRTFHHPITSSHSSLHSHSLHLLLEGRPYDLIRQKLRTRINLEDKTFCLTASTGGGNTYLSSTFVFPLFVWQVEA